MVKAEWGTKRSCPKCATRFYDLTKDDPISCISCGYAWLPESVLKSKQPMPFEQVVKTGKDSAEAEEADDLDLDVDDDGDSPDNDVDLGGDEDLGVDTAADGDDES
ncbi:MAG TPA: TIGR02300 family protein [Sphingopyxis sp.]|nr:TIGR02300 family protein [Sphingopyxis sp.]